MNLEVVCVFVLFPADDKGGMGGSAEERTRGEGAEAAGETRQRGEARPGTIETERNISSSTSQQFTLSTQK